VKGYATKTLDFLLSLPERLSGGNAEGRAPAAGYQSAFNANAPGSLNDDKDSDDDDEEDIGKDMAPQ
jgi:hypothetical protein